MKDFTFKQYITEQFYNDQLNPKYFNDDKEFDSNIRQKLLDLAWDLAESCGVTEHVQDIQLTGSMVNYNYTKYSDLDTHILLDFKDVNEDEELVKTALDSKRWIFNEQHDILMRGHEVELYFQDVDEVHRASGLYSLLDDEWLVEPKYDPPTVDEQDVLSKADQYARDVALLQTKLSSAATDIELDKLRDISSKLKSKIQRMRKDSLVRDGEFGIGNLAFKHLRNTGVIETLINISRNAYDKKFNESNDEISFNVYSEKIY